MQATGIEKLSPDLFSVGKVMLVKIRRGQSQELFPPGTVLGQHSIVNFGNALVFENVLQHFIFIHRIIPAHRFIQHHKKEAVQGLGKE